VTGTPRARGLFRAGLVGLALLAGPAAARAQGMALAPAESLDNAVYVMATGVEAEPELFGDVSFSAYQLLTASLQFDKQKLVFTPGRLFETYRMLLSELRFNASQSGGVTTLGLGTSYNGAAPDGERALGIAREIVAELPERSAGEGIPEYEKRMWPRVFQDFRERLSRGALLATVGANWQLFEVLGGTRVDDDGDGKDDHAHRLKAWNLGGSLSYAVDDGVGLQAGYHYARRRASSEEGSELVPHHGLSLSGAVRVATLDPDYRESDDYRRSLFVPSIVLGLGVEAQRCDGDAGRCKDAVRDQVVVTPFLDFRLAQSNQFRLGLPLERTVRFDDDSRVALKPVFQYSLQLSSP
jgi:hypothetical protein